jgi:hypothetical protein
MKDFLFFISSTTQYDVCTQVRRHCLFILLEDIKANKKIQKSNKDKAWVSAGK